MRLFCQACCQQTTTLEANLRVFNAGRCACGGRLSPAEATQLSLVSDKRTSGEGETNQRVEPEERHGANPSTGRP